MVTETEKIGPSLQPRMAIQRSTGLERSLVDDSLHDGVKHEISLILPEDVMALITSRPHSCYRSDCCVAASGRQLYNLSSFLGLAAQYRPAISGAGMI